MEVSYPMTILIFVIFNLILLLAFRGLVTIVKILGNKKFVVDKLSVSSIPVFVFFPVLSLFLIGNISVFANFFLPLKKLNLFWVVVLFILLFFNLKEPFQLDNKLFLFISLFIIPSVLSISSYGLKLHYDSIDYHINFQYWIREDKIVLGLSNLYIAYGWSTIYEYILSNFWFKDNFIFLHYVNIIFFTFFYNFVAYNILFSNNNFLKYTSTSIVMYSFLDNFGINGGGNGFLSIQMIGKPDLAVGVLYFVTLTLFLSDFLRNKFSYNNLVLITMLALFSFQIKIVSAYLIIPILIYVYKVRKNRISKIHIQTGFILVLLLISFIIKNILISGCVFFPIEHLCLNDLSWTDQSKVKQFSSSVVSNNNGLTFDTDLRIWFRIWMNNAYNLQVYSNMLLSFTIIYIINLLTLRKNINQNKRNEIYSIGFIIFIALAFFITGPTVRYGFGTFLIVLSLNTLRKNTPKKKVKIQIVNKSMIFILFISIILTPRIYSYHGFFESPLLLTEIEDSTEEYLNLGSLKDLKTIPIQNTKCFIPKTCVKNDDYKLIEYSKIGNYKRYVIKEN
jgi:hypothetical protein